MTTHSGDTAPVGATGPSAQPSPAVRPGNRPGGPDDTDGPDGPDGTASRPDTRRLVRWGVGMLAAGARYLVMRVPLYRRDRAAEQAASPPDLARPLPGDPATLQRSADGVGALFHRRYWIDLTDTATDAEGLIDLVAGRLDELAPTEVSSFEQTSGSGALQVGDELVVRLVGPWDGPVRVVDRTPTSFTFATLQGHMEAGEITFRTLTTERGLLRFEIESWARAGDERFDFLYDHVPLAREAQLLMWSHFCQQAAKLAGGVVMSNVAATTRRYTWDADAGRLRTARTTAPLGSRTLRTLPELPGQGLNFDPERLGAEAEGWHVDDYCGTLPAEEPGPPVDGGSWWTARRLLDDYAFADPALVRAAWYPDEPIDGRNMALEGRFLGLRFVMGLRIAAVRDDTLTVEGRPVRRYGWSYRTLDRHLERGEMDYAVWKWTDTGDVEFRVHAFSQPADIANPVVRLGFAAFGRTLQIRFARRAVARMQQLVERELSGRHHRLQPELLSLRPETAQGASGPGGAGID